MERHDSAGLPTGGAGAFGVRRVIYSVEVDEPLVALTFDDGPDPQFTPRVLAALAAHDIRATFCVMGYNALQHSDLLARVVAAGHEIAHHSWSHLDQSRLDPAQTAEEIRHGRQVIEELTGLTTRFFRPPRGELSGWALRVLAEDAQDVLMWSVTGSLPSPEITSEVRDFVLSHLAPGAIVDFHDGIGRGTFDPLGAPDLVARRNAELDGLPELIERALASGFRFGRVSDLLAHEVVAPAALAAIDPT
jgi:peptidoglycan/xylan/chitin deacetylase (PgdA/CDA1 family)